MLWGNGKSAWEGMVYIRVESWTGVWRRIDSFVYILTDFLCNFSCTRMLLTSSVSTCFRLDRTMLCGVGR
jgi:hypothetical protein